MRPPAVLLLPLFLFLATQILAEEEHVHAGMPAMPGMTHDSESQAPNPDPMAAMDAMEPGDRWMTMLHGFAFVTANRQGGPSGERAFEATSHFMLHSMRRLGGGKLTLRTGFSLDPFTVDPAGLPELFQRGETYHEVLLVDRQHPHDLLVEIGASWERSFARTGAVRFYVAPWGEPAVGPPVFLHRLSASASPISPLGHHNQDSTHISANVVTAAARWSVVTVEGSAFHGREPDENRLDVDLGAIDSYSGRVTVRPTSSLSLQVSAARRNHPEATEEQDQTRRTASVVWQRATEQGFLAASLILGENRSLAGTEKGNLLEATWRVGKNDYFGRIEDVDRDLYELIHKIQRPEDVPPETVPVRALTLGYVREIPFLVQGTTGLGANVTAYRFDGRLDEVYGSDPISVEVFLRHTFAHHF